MYTAGKTIRFFCTTRTPLSRVCLQALPFTFTLALSRQPARPSLRGVRHAARGPREHPEEGRGAFCEQSTARGLRRQNAAFRHHLLVRRVRVAVPPSPGNRLASFSKLPSHRPVVGRLCIPSRCPRGPSQPHPPPLPRLLEFFTDLNRSLPPRLSPRLSRGKVLPPRLSSPCRSLRPPTA